MFDVDSGIVGDIYSDLVYTHRLYCALIIHHGICCWGTYSLCSEQPIHLTLLGRCISYVHALYSCRIRRYICECYVTSACSIGVKNT